MKSLVWSQVSMCTQPTFLNIEAYHRFQTWQQRPEVRMQAQQRADPTVNVSNIERIPDLHHDPIHLGTRSSASSASMSNAVSVVMRWSVLKPIMRETKKAIPTAMIPKSQTAQKSAA